MGFESLGVWGLLHGYAPSPVRVWGSHFTLYSSGVSSAWRLAFGIWWLGYGDAPRFSSSSLLCYSQA